MLYLADNLAYIPFTVLDEPLFVIHQIDIMISVSGSNLLQTFKEVRRTKCAFSRRSVLRYSYRNVISELETATFGRSETQLGDGQD